MQRLPLKRSRLDATTTLEPARKQEIIAYGIEHGHIELTDQESQSNRIIVNKFITTLLYQSNRIQYGWDHPECMILRGMIAELKPKFFNKDRAYFEKYITRKETKHKTFYGSYLSDDSDSDQEREFQLQTETKKRKSHKISARLQKKAEIDKLLLQRKTGDRPKGALRVLSSNPASIFNLNARSKIRFSATIDKQKVSRDLTDLNNLLMREEFSLDQAIAELTRLRKEAGEVATSFYVAQYRGITYLTNTWNKPSRVAHRKDADEIGKRQYSSSVFKESINPFREYAASKQARELNPNELDDPANLLREILLTLREPRPYSYENYTYSNLAILLQNIYTQDYDGFRKLITENETLKNLLLNDGIPFLSMGDRPYHACKYAYGIKPYKGHEGNRLRPRWNAEGEAEWKHSGVVYTSLHPITDFGADGPLHLVSLNHQAEILLKDEMCVIPERESCFPGYVPEDRVVYKYVAKYPSFSGEYKEIHAEKYGFTKEIYEKFKHEITSTTPHSTEHRNAKRLLGEWLCAYHEIKMIREAEKLAEKRGGVLIYRHTNGTFSLDAPPDTINRKSARNPVTDKEKQPMKDKKATRRSMATKQKIINPLITKVAIDVVLETKETYSDQLVGDVAVTTDGNHAMSLPISLMLNALKNRRYLALRHFLTIDLFQRAVNEIFNSEGLENASLLHIAVARNDLEALEIILASNHCDPDVMGYDLVDYIDGHQYSFGNLTPLCLAITLETDEAALKIIRDPRTDLNALFNFVSTEYNNIAGTPQPRCHVIFITNNTALHLAVLCNKPHVVQALLDAGIDPFIVNSTGLTALDIAISYKRTEIEDLLREPASDDEDDMDDALVMHTSIRP